MLYMVKMALSESCFELASADWTECQRFRIGQRSVTSSGLFPEDPSEAILFFKHMRHQLMRLCRHAVMRL
jgi:hypothetical protein